MALPKEGQPTTIETPAVELVSKRELLNVLDYVGVPTPLRKRILDKVIFLSSDQALENAVNNLSEEERDQVLRKWAGELNLEEEVQERLMDGIGEQFDSYLGEVSKQVFGFKLSDLSAEERQQVMRIRNELKVPGTFNPDA